MSTKKNPKLKTAKTTKVKVVGVDCTWLMHRGFHVRPASMPYMVFGWVCRFAVTREATHLVPCFDTGRSFRHGFYDEYKSDRGISLVNEYVPQVLELFQQAGFGALRKDTFEADDLLATLSALGSPTVAVEMATPDKDNFQCIHDHCLQLRPGVSGKEDVVWDVKKLHQEFGFTPAQFLDYQTLLGDATDTIPKILTPAKAKKAVLEFGSLKKYMEKNPDFTEEHGEALQRNRKLVKLVKDACEVDLTRFAVTRVKKGLKHKSQWYQELVNGKRSLFSL